MVFKEIIQKKIDETIAKGKDYATQQLNEQANKYSGQMQTMVNIQQSNVNLNDYPEFVQSVVDCIKKSNNNGYLSKMVRSELEPKTRVILHKIADLPAKQLFGVQSAVNVQRGRFYGFKKPSPPSFGGVSTRRRKRRGKKTRKH